MTYLAAGQVYKARAVLDRSDGRRFKDRSDWKKQEPPTAPRGSSPSGSFPAATSRDGKIVAIADTEGEILLNERATGQSLGRLRIPEVGKIVRLEFTTDNKVLRLYSDKGIAWDVDAATGRVLRKEEQQAPVGGSSATGGGLKGRIGEQPAQPPRVPDQLRLLPLKNAKARDVEATLKKVIQDVKISIDERTNSILLSGPRDLVEKVEELIHKLDSPDEANVDPESGKRALELLRGLHAPSAPASEAIRPPSTPAALGGVDLANLAGKMADARAALKRAQAAHSRLMNLPRAALSQKEFDSTTINLLAAEEKLRLLTALLQSAIDSARSDLAAARTRAAYSRRMAENGFLSQPQAARDEAKAVAAEKQLKFLESLRSPSRPTDPDGKADPSKDPASGGSSKSDADRAGAVRVASVASKGNEGGLNGESGEQREPGGRDSVEQRVADAQVIVVATALDSAQAPPKAPGDLPEVLIRFQVTRVLKGKLADKVITTRTPTAAAGFIGKEWVVLLPPEYMAGKHQFASCLSIEIEPTVKALLARDKK